MRWWDAGVRWKAGFAVANAIALGLLATGWVRATALASAALGVFLIARSLRFGAPAPLTLAETPRVEGGVLLGRGFEWTPEVAQQALETGGEPWPSDGNIVLPDSLLGQHVLLLGTTGVGKTRLLELLALQAIARGDAVIILDPKGDEGLQRRVAEAAGGRFRLFSLPHPERSVRYNPVGRYRDPREVADRIAGLLPSAGDALPFRNFAWEIVHVAAGELHGRKPMTLRNLKRAALDRPVGPLAQRPRDHYLKMASALLPLMSKLATEQLSPESGGLSWEELDRDRQVCLFSLGSLLGFETASAVAKIAVADLQAYVGDRYAFGKGHGPVWLFVDELADVATVELVGLLNKSRGAGLRVIACAQTLADLEAALGSRARALQVTANMNTLVNFRAQNSTDASLFSEMAGDRLLRVVSEGAMYEPALLGSGLKEVDDFRARFGETSDVRERPLVPPWALVQLPSFHFYARWEGRVYRGRAPLLR